MCKKSDRFLQSLLCALIVFFILTGGAEKVQSQDKYPTRAIDLIVPFIPGGGTDLYGRMVAEVLKKKWGVPVNVINKAGGNTVPANLEVHQAAPDGYTLLVDGQSSCSLLEVAIKDLPFKVMDRTFVGLVAASPSVIAVAASSPWKNMKDLEAEAKREPQSFTWSSFGGVGAGDYFARQFFKAIGVDVLKTRPVVTRGTGETNTLVANSSIKMGSGSAAGIHPMVKTGMIRAVGITGFRMPDLYPDLPTTAEQGYPTVDQVWWVGFSGPPKLPSHIVNKWNEALQEIMKDPEFVTKVKNFGGAPFYLNSTQFKDHVRKEMEDVAKLWGVK